MISIRTGTMPELNISKIIGEIYVYIIVIITLFWPSSSLKKLKIGCKLSKIEMGVIITTQVKKRIIPRK